METSETLSIIICSYNRADVLSICLEDLINKISCFNHIEVIVVDNGSNDHTQMVVNRIKEKFPAIVYIFEQRIGLSNARNKGGHNANSKWLVYLDDDALLGDAFIQLLDSIIKEYEFDCFGGMYYAWYLDKKPKWIPNEFGNKIKIIDRTGEIDGTKGWLTGNNLIVRKSVFLKVGGFDMMLGMKGSKIGYGEENLFQEQVLAYGYKIGFCPELYILHAVLPHKLKLSWHLKNSFAMGKYTQVLANQGSTSQLVFKLVKSSLGALLKHFPRNAIRYFNDEHFYIQNLVLNTFKPPLWYLGVLYKKLESD